MRKVIVILGIATAGVFLIDPAAGAIVLAVVVSMIFVSTHDDRSAFLRRRRTE